MAKTERIHNRQPALQEILKEVLQAEGIRYQRNMALHKEMNISRDD